MLRTGGLQDGSGIQDFYHRSPQDITTADASYKFPHIHASRVWVVGYGLSINAFTGTSARVDVRLRILGNLGALPLEFTNLGAGHTTLITGEEMTGTGWRAVRAGPGQKFLAERIGGGEGYGLHTFDANENFNIMLEIQKTAISVFDGFCWVQVRVIKKRDDILTFGTEQTA